MRDFRGRFSFFFVCPSFPFGTGGRLWDVIVLIPDHCLSIFFCAKANGRKKVTSDKFSQYEMLNPGEAMRHALLLGTKYLSVSKNVLCVHTCNSNPASKGISDRCRHLSGIAASRAVSGPMICHCSLNSNK